MTPEMNMPFDGAKLALFLGEELAVILRDARPDIPYPDHWDLPGGGREGEESALDCALRETREELGLKVPVAAVTWGRVFEEGGLRQWLFAAHLPAEAAQRVVFGSEGQRWQVMAPRDYMRHTKAIPKHQARLRLYLEGEGLIRKTPRCL